MSSVSLTILFQRNLTPLILEGIDLNIKMLNILQDPNISFKFQTMNNTNALNTRSIFIFKLQNCNRNLPVYYCVRKKIIIDCLI